MFRREAPWDQDYDDGLGMSGAARANLLVRRVLRIATRITHSRYPNAVAELPKKPLRAPEAAKAEDGNL